VIETDKETIEESVARIFAKLEELKYLEPEVTDTPEADLHIFASSLATLEYL